MEGEELSKNYWKKAQPLLKFFSSGQKIWSSGSFAKKQKGGWLGDWPTFQSYKASYCYAVLYLST